MGIEELYKELDRAYSDENLNLITGKLILLYKNRNYGKIREIAGKVMSPAGAAGEKDAKVFSRLMMMYHPDRGAIIRQSIRQFYNSRDLENLNKHSHVLLLSDIDQITVHEIDQDIDYYPEYIWGNDYEEGPFIDDPGLYTDLDDPIFQGFEDFFTERNVYNAIRFKGFGNIDKGFHSLYLRSLEEFDLANNGLESLDGIEYCIHARYLDFSNNNLSDISKLCYLNNIEELYLENNHISFIDALDNLINLRILDLSGNYINDITPLTELENLQFVNLIGNPVPASQIESLRAKGILVMDH
jgi:Leucine-rich repeat (LRR) protein